FMRPVSSGVGVRARGQAVVNSYFVNDGTNDTFDPPNAEIAIDLGGMIPFERYLDTNSTTGHYFARNWIGGPPSFYDAVRAHWTDLVALDQDIQAHGAPSYAIVRFRGYPPSGCVAEVGGHPSIDRMTWWNRRVKMWPYGLSGAPVLICVRMPYTGPNAPAPNSNPSLLFVN